MAAIASLLIVLTISLLVTRIAAMALMLTGMSREAARFQSRSAFSGVGFTTGEAEDVVAHPIRRRIVMLLMLLGNLGIGAVVATLMLSFMNTSREDAWLNLIALTSGVVLLWLVARSRYIERHLNRVISWVLRRWGNLQVRDYVAILQLQGGFAVSELVVEPNDWLSGRTLMDLRLPDEGVLVLGIHRATGSFIGTPTGEMEVRPSDTLILYGPVDRIDELDRRRRGRQGDDAHREAVEQHVEGLHEQVELDRHDEERRKLEEEQAD